MITPVETRESSPKAFERKPAAMVAAKIANMSGHRPELPPNL